MFILSLDCLHKVMDKSSVSFECKHTYEVLLQNFSQHNSKNDATGKIIALADLVLCHHNIVAASIFAIIS